MSAAFCIMASGRKVDFVNPEQSTISIEDIAHGLAAEARWNGQTDWLREGNIYCVAQHCVLVAIEVAKTGGTTQETLCALFHDAAEGTGMRDLATPVKSLCPDYRETEKRFLRWWFVKHGLPIRWAERLPLIVEHADKTILAREALSLCHPSVQEHIDCRGAGGGRVVVWPAVLARSLYLKLANKLLEAQKSEQSGT